MVLGNFGSGGNLCAIYHRGDRFAGSHLVDLLVGAVARCWLVHEATSHQGLLANERVQPIEGDLLDADG